MNVKPRLKVQESQLSNSKRTSKSGSITTAIVSKPQENSQAAQIMKLARKVSPHYAFAATPSNKLDIVMRHSNPVSDVEPGRS